MGSAALEEVSVTFSFQLDGLGDSDNSKFTNVQLVLYTLRWFTLRWRHCCTLVVLVFRLNLKCTFYIIWHIFKETKSDVDIFLKFKQTFFTCEDVLAN